MLDIFKEFFKQNPSKILGEMKETTDRFGNPDITIVGELENLEMIDVSELNTPTKNINVENVNLHSLSEYAEDDNIKKSLSITKDNILKSETLKKAIPKKRKDFSIFIDGDSSQELFTQEDSSKILNKGFDDATIEVWSWYNSYKGIPQTDFFEKRKPISSKEWFDKQMNNGYLCFDAQESSYIPSIIYYSGNIYDKIVALTDDKSKSLFEYNYLNKQYTKQLEALKNILPNALKLDGEKDQRLVLSVLGKFASSFEIEYEGEKKTILDCFIEFISSLDTEDLVYNIRSWNIVSYYIRGERMPNHYDKYEKIEIKRKSAQECVIQLSKFLADEISQTEREKIEYFWNKQHNGYVDINYDRIPLAFEYSKYFKNGDLVVRNAQREGVAFQVSNGTGIIAYDVGVGKTLTAILNVANAIQSGQSKRPLIVVPKSTYGKWVSEINGVFDDEGNLIGSGILPQYNILDLYNLDTTRISKLYENGNLISIPEKTICICTYEGLQKIGFSDNVGDDFMMELKEILNQGYGDSSERKKALEDEKLNKIIGIGQEGSILNIDEAGFDYLVIDEAHNFNKIFSSVKGELDKDGSRSKNSYKITGSQSSRAIKAFFVSNYIQKNNKQGNICLLSATPFTNNPLEVFNILALTNVNKLKDLGIKSIVSFFDNYVNQTYEKVIKSTGEIEESAVIKGWNNKVSLQKILFSYMNYKSGEDANITRPEKWTLPKLSENVDGTFIPLPFEKQLTTYLNPTSEQKENQKEISSWLISQLKDSDLMKKAPHLVADIKSKKNCISPYIYNNINPNEILPVDFINSSPKLKYTMECIKSVVDWHKKDGSPLSCQVIYINGGVEYLHLIKMYLIKEIGYKEKVYEHKKNKYFDEVEILSGSGQFKREDEEKEEIKTLFNEGKIKIIIGTSTIREGIDLQKKSTVLYSLWVDWNPTDYKQLEGRVWRFGNEYSNVRIVSPLLVGSSDAFTYQKLEEKTARINDIFDRNDKSNILDIGEEDRESIKWALIDDLKEIAKSKIKDEVQSIKKQKSVIEGNVTDLNNVSYEIKKLTTNTETLSRFNDKFFKYVDISILNKEFEGGDVLHEYKAIKSQSENIISKLLALGLSSYDLRQSYRESGYYKDIKKSRKDIESINTKLKDKYGASIDDDLETIKDKMNLEIEAYQVKLLNAGSNEYFDNLLDELEVEKKKFNGGIDNFNDTVDKFKKLNYLLGETSEKQQLIVKQKDEIVESINVSPIEIETKQEDLSSEIQELIDTLEILKETAEKESKDEIEELIDTLKLLI